ncbi:hypothetical protein [Streptomyces aidingensis]|uniref:Haemolysin XhlA n=1 Tax=Streptomyces aidingensis TaxID=910347 RepID=A0A1I1PXM5_9ACTN|nr:hypothetical protein [Streptomyces aidingensis]SFD12358.1 hypothetical protein SAMN05421773_1106 [Streptomyces aidingensis]
MTEAGEGRIAQELGRVHDVLDVLREAVGEVKTLCAVLVSRSDRTERDVRDLRREMEEETGAIRQEMEELKRGQWIRVGWAAGAGTVFGGVGTYVVQAVLGA